MEFCRFCGREIPDGSSCSCPDALKAQKNTDSVINKTESGEANHLQSVNLSKEKPENADKPKSEPKIQHSAPVTQPSRISDNGLTPSNEPDPLKQLFTLAAVLVGFILILVFLGSRSGYKSTAKDYFKARYSKHGGKTYYSLVLPEDGIDELKDDDEWKELIEDYNDQVENRMKDWDKKPKFKKISKSKEMKNSELKQAEEYFYRTARACDADVDKDDFKAKKGYAVTIKYKNTEGDNDKTTIYVVKIKGDGWKVMSDIGSVFYGLDS